VARTQESVILEDASAQHPFSADAYFRRQPARSILCLPLINQAKLIGLLYLENNLTPHIFTPDRITVLKVLASQAAISLENTRLYRDLKEREEALRQSEAYLSEAQRLSRTGSFGWDVPSGKIYWSQETFRIFACDPSAEPTLGLVLQRTHPEDKRMVRELIDRVSNEKKIFDFEHRLLMPDGSTKYLRVVGRPSTKDESGRFEFVGAVTDITERRRAEEAVSKAQAELAHVSRVVTMGELTTSIAHEVNQPLTAALNSASACLRWLAANELDEARQSTSRVIASVRRASEIIAGIRALAKKAPPQKELLDLNETIGQAIVMVRNELHHHNVSLQTQLANNLPLIKGDRVQLQQVILNLFINAIEAMAEIEEDPRILWVSSERTTDLSGDPDGVLIGVRDSGPGLDMRSLDRLFDSFYTTKAQGLGMGLAISRSIIEAHGGRLWAENAVRGAIFRFSLPIQNE
jgi:signal transduction histidine kinase